MITFPDYDFGWTGGTDAAVAEGEQTAGSTNPAPPFTIGVVFKDIKEGTGDIYNEAKNVLSGAYWKLIFGVAIIGIIALVVLGAGARFMRTIEGGN